MYKAAPMGIPAQEAKKKKKKRDGKQRPSSVGSEAMNPAFL